MPRVLLAPHMGPCHHYPVAVQVQHLRPSDAGSAGINRHNGAAQKHESPLDPESCSLAAQGADTVIYERLDLQNPVNKELRGVTRQHMEAFGAGGLRTLCLSYAELDHATYDECALHALTLS